MTCWPKSLGVWLINFYLSWKRGVGQNVPALILHYEEDVLDPDRFVDRIGSALSMDEEQRARLRAFAAKPDRRRARLNIGRAGRGRERLPAASMEFLQEYAKNFEAELTPQEQAYLTH